MIEVITPEDELRIPVDVGMPLHSDDVAADDLRPPDRGPAPQAFPLEDEGLPITQDICDSRLLAFMRRWSHRPDRIQRYRDMRYVLCRFCRFIGGYFGLGVPRMLRPADGDHGTERLCPEEDGL